MSIQPPVIRAYTAQANPDGSWSIYNAGTRESQNRFTPRNDRDMQMLETVVELLNQKPPTRPHLAVPAWSLLIRMWMPS